MKVTELAARLRHYGLTVVEVAGWQTRGNEFPVRPDGAVRHWTAGPATGETPCLGVVTNGRSDLPGPLCNAYQSRRVDSNGLDVVYVVAAGKANHAGAGTWNGISGNYKLLGLEIEWSGPNEAFANVRRRKLTSELIMRALMDCCTGTNDNDACEHREYAPTRKIDTNLSGDELRRRMTELRGAPAPAPTPSEEDDMADVIIWYTGPHAYKVNGVYATHIKDDTELNTLKNFWKVPEFNTRDKPVPVTTQTRFLDGPHKNVANLADIQAIPAAVVKALPPSSTGGITPAQVRAEVDAALSFLKPGQ